MTDPRNAPPSEGTLLRLPVAAPAWTEELPPVPAGADVTVAFSHHPAWVEHAEALALLGYRVVGVHGGDADHSTADFLVSPAVARAHPCWARALAARSTRAYDLALGPVGLLLGPALWAHLSPAHEG